MKIQNSAVVGSLESNDVMVMIEPSDEDLQLSINSIVYKQFGKEIEDTVRKVCKEWEVNNAKIEVNDRGALKCTIEARMEAAILRSKGEIL